MPGFVIHLAIGKQYIKKHKDEINNKEEFLKGIVAPDLNKEMTNRAENKNKTHYGNWLEHQEIDLRKFLQNEKVNINLDYWKGYFIHLITDYYFCNITFNKEFQQLLENRDSYYYDYDCLNGVLTSKYGIKIYNKYISKQVQYINDKPKYLKYDKIIDFIEKISDFNIQETIDIIKEKGMEGLK